MQSASAGSAQDVQLFVLDEASADARRLMGAAPAGPTEQQFLVRASVKVSSALDDVLEARPMFGTGQRAFPCLTLHLRLGLPRS